MGKDIFSRIAPMVCDAHIHVGKFKDGLYFSPEEIYGRMKSLGIQKWAVSSTSAISGNYQQATTEIKALVELAPEQTLPLLWVTPEMSRKSRNFKEYEAVSFYGIKIHGYANSWDPKGESIKKVLRVALERQIPVLMHTGGRPESDAGSYEEICSVFHDLKIVLAHGRPVEQAIQVMKSCSNVYVETSFMPVRDIRQLVKEVGVGRILFGTDFPIESFYYPSQSIVSRYKRRVNTLVNSFGEEVFIKWANENFHKIFYGS